MPNKFLNKPLRILLATNSLILIAGAMLAPIYAFYVEKIGGDILDASFTGGVFALAAGITTIIAGKYADKIKENELIVIFGYLSIGIGFFLYLFVNSIFSLLLVQILIGFSEAVLWPAYDAIYTKHIPKTKLGRAWGFWEGMNYFSIAIGSLVGGIIVNYFGFFPLFILMGMLSIGSGLYLYSLPRKLL